MHSSGDPSAWLSASRTDGRGFSKCFWLTASRRRLSQTASAMWGGGDTWEACRSAGQPILLGASPRSEMFIRLPCSSTSPNTRLRTRALRGAWDSSNPPPSFRPPHPEDVGNVRARPRVLLSPDRQRQPKPKPGCQVPTCCCHLGSKESPTDQGQALTRVTQTDWVQENHTSPREGRSQAMGAAAAWKEEGGAVPGL